MCPKVKTVLKLGFYLISYGEFSYKKKKKKVMVNFEFRDKIAISASPANQGYFSILVESRIF